MVKNDQYRQVKLMQGNRVIDTNVPDHKLLKEGSLVTLPEEGEGWWEVVRVSDQTRHKSQLNRGWDNNI